MTTAVNIIKRSLSLIGVHSDINPAPAQSLNTALDVLKEMLAEWEEDAISLGTIDIADLTTDLLEPAGTVYTICNNLAVRMAPLMQVGVSPNIVNSALEGYMKVMDKYGAEETPHIPNATPSSHLPVGQGSSRGAYGRAFFSGKLADDETSNT